MNASDALKMSCYIKKVCGTFWAHQSLHLRLLRVYTIHLSTANNCRHEGTTNKAPTLWFQVECRRLHQVLIVLTLAALVASQHAPQDVEDVLSGFGFRQSTRRHGRRLPRQDIYNKQSGANGGYQQQSAASGNSYGQQQSGGYGQQQQAAGQQTNSYGQQQQQQQQKSANNGQAGSNSYGQGSSASNYQDVSWIVNESFSIWQRCARGYLLKWLLS